MLADGNLDPATSPGLIQVPTRIRQVNGKPLNTLFADITGAAHFDETFPAFAWYTVESDTTRFRSTGVHVVNDAGGPVDGPTSGGENGNTGPYQGILSSKEAFSLPTLPTNLRVTLTPAATVDKGIGVVPVGVAHPAKDFYGNQRPDPSEPTRFDIGAIEVAGGAAALQPTLTAISPGSGYRGAGVVAGIPGATVTLTGTNLTAASTVNVSGGAGSITVSNISVNPAGTSLTATFTIASTAGLTTRNVTVTTQGGTSNAEPFTVLGPR